MNTTQQPILVRTLDDESYYDSFSQAIEATRAIPRAATAERDTSRLRGMQIKDVAYDDASLIIHLGNEYQLSFSLAGGLVAWSTEDTPDRDPLRSLPDDPWLQFVDQQPFRWRRSVLAQDLLDTRIIRVAAGHAWAYLDVGGSKLLELMMMRIRRCDTGADILFWDYC